MANPLRSRLGPFGHAAGADEDGRDGYDHVRGEIQCHRHSGAERTCKQAADGGGADEGEDTEGLLSRDRLRQVILADHSGDEGRPGGRSQRRGRAEDGD